MNKTMLIYERAVPITKDRHSKWSVKNINNYAFASKVNSMPLLALEFRNAVSEYPIVFAGTEDNFMPTVLLGIKEENNLFVNESGEWNASYVPAFARRYPFVFSSVDQGKTLTLCVDEEFSGLNEEGDGESFFDENGELTQYLKNVLDFQQEYQKHFSRTQQFCEQLKELEILDPMQAQFEYGSGEKMALTGFMVVNRDRLKALSGERLEKLASTDELELIYLHLQSMHNVKELAQRLNLSAKNTEKESSSGDVEEEAGKNNKKKVTRKKSASKRKEKSSVKD